MVFNGKNIFKNYPLRIILASLFILLFICLKTWNSFAPWSTHDWNKKEFSRIKVSDPEDFTFAVFGDNKGNHSVFEPLLRDINQSKEIAFVMDVGDLVRDGKRGQFQHLLDQVQKNLTIPFVTAIGNHDLNNGSSIYQEIFGPTYYAFQVGQSYFIVLDATVESGFGKTEYQWLENELQKAQAL